MDTAMRAPPHATLISELLDSRITKSEREHAAKREIERLQVDMKTCRANYVALNARIDRLTTTAILRERERKGLLDLLELVRDDVDHALFHLKQLHRQLPEYDAEMAKKQNILDRIDAAVKEQEDE